MSERRVEATDAGAGLGGEFDAVVIGAGAAGLYMLHRLRGLGFSVRVFEQGEGVGGTWYWNRYPGARCDVESWDYCFSFSEELEQEWDWSERYPTQAELERYFNYVADRFDLRGDIEFGTRVERARFDEGRNRWIIATSLGATVSARYLVSAAGCLSAVNKPPITGAETFEGERHHTARWPAEGVDVGGKRVGVIGTGSSGVQVIPQVAKRAEHVFVFQRTAQYTVPARNHPLDDDARNEFKGSFGQRQAFKRTTPAGLSRPRPVVSSALEADAATRIDVLEASWQRGGPGFAMTFDDILTDPASNDEAARFVRDKIRAKVDDPKVAETLVDIDYPLGARRLIVDIDYFETYNRDNVTLVDVGAAPITEITPRGLRTRDGHYDLDVLVYATGFDGMTGALLSMDICGVGGLALTTTSIRVPEPVHDHRAGQSGGVQQRDAVDRAARLRHRIRRDDRRAAVDGHLRGRRAGAAGQVGPRGGHLHGPRGSWVSGSESGSRGRRLFPDGMFDDLFSSRGRRLFMITVGRAVRRCSAT